MSIFIANKKTELKPIALPMYVDTKAVCGDRQFQLLSESQVAAFRCRKSTYRLLTIINDWWAKSTLSEFKPPTYRHTLARERNGISVYKMPVHASILVAHTRNVRRQVLTSCLIRPQVDRPRGLYFLIFTQSFGLACALIFTCNSKHKFYYHSILFDGLFCPQN